MGHSMGGMAAMKLAAAQPRRIVSLTIISSTGGGWEAIPSTWRAIRYAWMVGRKLSSLACELAAGTRLACNCCSLAGPHLEPLTTRH